MKYVAVYQTGHLCPVSVDFFEAEDHDAALEHATQRDEWENHWRNHYRLIALAEVVHQPEWVKQQETEVS